MLESRISPVAVGSSRGDEGLRGRGEAVKPPAEVLSPSCEREEVIGGYGEEIRQSLAPRSVDKII